MRRRLVYLTAQTNTTRMVTLTASVERYRDPHAAAARMGAALTILVARMRARWNSEPIEYLAVWERTKNGWPHLHVALRGPFIPQRWISQQWQGLTGAPVVDVRHLGTSGGTGRYLAKYLAKDPDPFLRGRAFRASKGFFLEPMRPQGGKSCTFGKLNVYQSTVWDWLMIELNALRLVNVQPSGLSLSRAWADLPGTDDAKHLRWHRQRVAVAAHEHPPDADPPPDWRSLFTNAAPES